MRTCKYCGAEATYRQEICEPCFQAGNHHPWWIQPVAAIVAVVLAVLFFRYGR